MARTIRWGAVLAGALVGVFTACAPKSIDLGGSTGHSGATAEGAGATGGTGVGTGGSGNRGATGGVVTGGTGGTGGGATGGGTGGSGRGGTGGSAVVCGDGVIEGNETCDDGNVASADGCSADCEVEPGFSCAGGAVCLTVCGDGIVAASEACDDGNVVSGDGCSADCELETDATGDGCPNAYCGAGGNGPELSVGCDYEKMLQEGCATVGCHKGTTRAAQAGLILTPDNDLVARIKNVPATFGDIFCTDIMDYCPTPPAACPPSALLVDSADWTKSWMNRKMSGTACGDPMPIGSHWSADDQQCFVRLIEAIAALP
jgi:cysteine-rich repeat protein